jgi:hypothetical protein
VPGLPEPDVQLIHILCPIRIGLLELLQKQGLGWRPEIGLMQFDLTGKGRVCSHERIDVFVTACQTQLFEERIQGVER